MSIPQEKLWTPSSLTRTEPNRTGRRPKVPKIWKGHKEIPSKWRFRWKSLLWRWGSKVWCSEKLVSNWTHGRPKWVSVDGTVVEHGFVPSNRPFNRPLTAQFDYYLHVAHPHIAHTILPNVLNLLLLLTVGRVSESWSQGLKASKRNTRSAPGPSLFHSQDEEFQARYDAYNPTPSIFEQSS